MIACNMNDALISTIKCPSCGHLSREEMPTDSCLYFYECGGCSNVIRPLPGDCCVFCSYGTHKCPPKTAEQDCCGQ